MTLRAPLRPCANTRCKRLVFDAQVVKDRGAPLDVVLDAQPRTWADGARVKLVESGHLPDGVQHVKKLTASQVHQAFAVAGLYVEHREVCEAEQRRTKAKKKDGTHA